jgi:ATP-dependent helicase/nuclease subunit B
MVSLAATSLRSFDAALLIGADARHLPVAPHELLFMSNAVRADLGLATADRALHAQSAQLAALIAGTPRVAASWRIRHGDEPNALSPLLERLQFVAQRALGADMAHAADRQAHLVVAGPLSRPAPSAARLLPRRISASHAQSLVNCAYQFYARRMLQLVEPDDVIEVPDKRDFGVALHEVLHRFHREWGDADFRALDRVRLAESLRTHARTVFDAQIERAPGMLAFARRFDGLVDGYVDWLRRHSAAGWRWAAGEDARVQPVALRDGRMIELTGRIDRIDSRQHTNGGCELLVVDYKARAADDLKRGLQTPGEDVQLPLYGLLLGGEASCAAYLSFERGREEEPGVRQVDPPAPFGDLVVVVESRLRADLQRIADGAPLPAIGARSICQRCEMRGLCRRDYWEHDNGLQDGAAHG